MRRNQNEPHRPWDFLRRVVWQILLLLVAVSLSPIESWSDENPPSGDSTIRSRTKNSEIVIQTTSRLAGAIHSLKWKDHEFIDSADHGRQLQSASNFDVGTPLTAETFNPTEAGSRRDGAGQTSSDRLLHLVAKNNLLQTTNQMAFWLAPNETSDGHFAKNQVVLSDHLLTKRVRIGYGNLDSVIQYNVTFSLPVGEFHRHAVFESLTGYMPAEFEVFWKFRAANGELEPLDDGPGEQSLPVVLATKDGSYAMGVYSPDQPSRGYHSAGYGRFRFPHEKVVKWNCVFRLDDPDGISPGDYSFRNFVAVGDLNLVKESLRILTYQFRK